MGTDNDRLMQRMNMLASLEKGFVQRVTGDKDRQAEQDHVGHRSRQDPRQDACR